MSRSRLLPILLVCPALAGQTPTKPKPMSLQEAIRTSLENNLQVEIARQTRTAAKASVDINLGTFDWTLTGALTSSRQDFATEVSSQKEDATLWSRSLTVGATKAFPWGGSLALSYEPVYSSETIGGISTALPYGSGTSKAAGLTATYTQSLLRGFGREVTEANLIVAKNSSTAADYTYQKAIIDLVASTESLYWDVVYAQRNLETIQQALELAQKQLRENRIRVEVGTLAPIEVTSAEAAVAQQEQSIISAEAALQNAKDALIRALYPGSDKPADIEPADAPTLSHIAIDEAAGEQMAIDRRVELKAYKLDVASKGVLRRAAENKLKPQLDAYVGYTGDSYDYKNLGSVNSDLAGFKYPGYAVGVNFSMPIGNHTAKGNLAAARASERGSELTLRDEELAIRLEVREAFRNVDAAEKGVEAAKRTRIYREKDLDAEQKKFDNGMSTNFLVLSKQNDLDTAKSAEVQAQITYAKAVTSMEKAVGNLLEARGFNYPE